MTQHTWQETIAIALPVVWWRRRKRAEVNLVTVMLLAGTREVVGKFITQNEIGDITL